YARGRSRRKPKGAPQEGRLGGCLQRRDARLDRRMAREEAEEARLALLDAMRLERLRQLAGLEAAEPRERRDHRLAIAHQANGARVGAELALAREPGDDHRGED